VNQPAYGSSVALGPDGHFVIAYTVGTGASAHVQANVDWSWVTGRTVTQSVSGLTGWGTTNSYAPSVSMNSSGQQFVIAWMHDYSSTDTDIYVQEFDSSGSALGGAFGVATSASYESSPSVSMNSSGGFAVDYFWADSAHHNHQHMNFY